MKYHKLYAKLIALSADQSTTPGERLSAKNKARQIYDKYLKPKQRKRNPGRSQYNFHFQSEPANQYSSTIKSIFAENPELKEQLKQAIFGAIKERDELKRKGEL